MAEAPKTDTIDKALLNKIVSGEVKFVSPAEGLAMVQHNPPLIEVNPSMTDPNDASKAAVRATAAAASYLAAGASAPAEASKYAIITNAVLPAPKKRGNSFGSGAPTKYPFADLPVGGSFFSANSEHSKGDAVKALGSTVSSQNRKYAEPTGEKKTITRAVRDKTTHKAQIGPDGKKVTETVQLDKLKYSRKFTIRPVVSGETYGGWTAPADGALIARTV